MEVNGIGLTQTYRVTFRARAGHQFARLLSAIESDGYRKVAGDSNLFETTARGISAYDAAGFVQYDFGNVFGDEFEIYDCIGREAIGDGDTETVIAAHAASDGPAVEPVKFAGRTRTKRVA